MNGTVLGRYTSKAQLYKAVDHIRAKQSIPTPCDPYLLAEQLSVPIVYEDFHNPKICGALIRYEAKAAVVLSNAHLFGSERFTLAHELGHYFLHDGVAQFLCDGNNSPLEWQANTMAAELLLPWRMLLPRLRDLALMGGGTLELLHRMAREYQVSPLILRRRVDDLSYELWQAIQGVPIPFVQMVSRGRQQRQGLPAGPTAADLFRPTHAILDLYDDRPSRPASSRSVAKEGSI